MQVSNLPLAAVAYVFRGSLVLSVTRVSTGQHSAPGGKVEPGETPEQAMRRELFEETGLVALTARHVYEADNPHSGYRTHAYLVTVADDAEPIAREPGTTIAWVTPLRLASGFCPEFHFPGLAAAVIARKESAP